MAVATVAKMKCHQESTTAPQVELRRDKSRRKKRKMSSRTAEASRSAGDAAGNFSARVKRFHSKSRRGCLTCRTRRVKCDEERTPNCKRCDKGGYLCEWQDGRLGRPRNVEDPSRRISTASRDHSSATQTSEEDGLHPFFTEGTVASVTSLFVDMADSFSRLQVSDAQLYECGSKFYYQFVYQASLTSSVIRTTLTALRGLYESLRIPGGTPQHHEYLSRFGEAMMELRTSSTAAPPDVVLIASVLFANCEYLMGDWNNALCHLRGGAKLLRESYVMIHNMISPELVELLMQIFDVFDEEDKVMGSLGQVNELQQVEPFVQPPFDTLSDANDALLQMYRHTFALRRVAYNHPRHVEPAAQDFQRLSNVWLSRSEGLGPTLDMEQSNWLKLLQGQQSALNLVIDDLSGSSGELPTSVSAPTDDYISPQISSFLQAHLPQYLDSDYPSRPFAKNVGILLPLMLITLRSSDSQVCETALSIMASCSISEGVLTSCCAYAVGRAVLNARHAMKFSLDTDTATFDSALPRADLQSVTASSAGTELDITICFSTLRDKSNAIVGAYCLVDENTEALCRALEAGGYQGPILAKPLPYCSCHDPV